MLQILPYLSLPEGLWKVSSGNAQWVAALRPALPKQDLS